MAVAMPRCGQPVHSTGGRGMTRVVFGGLLLGPARQVETGRVRSRDRLAPA